MIFKTLMLNTYVSIIYNIFVYICVYDDVIDSASGQENEPEAFTLYSSTKGNNTVSSCENYTWSPINHNYFTCKMLKIHQIAK